jgi:hypothetical protein
MEFDHNLDNASIIPLHLIGLVLDGEFETSKTIFRYSIQTSTEQELDSAYSVHPAHHHTPSFDIPNSIDFSESLSWGFSTSLSMKSSGLSLGFSTMRNPIIETGNPDDGSIATRDSMLVDQTITSIYAREISMPYEITAEYFSLKNENRIGSNRNYSSKAFYLQLGYYFNPSLKVSYRFADLDVSRKDLLTRLLSLRNQSHHVLSLRYDFDEFNTAKLEVDFTNSDDHSLDGRRTYRIQWSFLLHK